MPKKPTTADFFNIDFGDLDFDLGDFDLDFEDAPESDEATRIITPRLDTSILTNIVHFDHALELAMQIDLTGQARTFAFVSGAFIFGDIVEALWRARHVDIKNLYIASLSVSQENIDSWAGLMKYADPPMEHFDLVLSGYFYSHNKYNIIPYMYEQCGNDDRFQCAFGAYHMKIIAIETHHGNTITIHGSANTRSSNSVEQVMVEVNQPDLFAACRDFIHSIAQTYGTVRHAAPRMTQQQITEHFEKMKGDRKP